MGVEAAARLAAGRTLPRGGRLSERWQAVKHASPGAELQQETTASGVRMIRGRLAPDARWTPWAQSLRKVVAELEAMAGGAR